MLLFVLITVFETFNANSSNVFSLFSLYPSTFSKTLTFADVCLFAIKDKICCSAFKVSPLYPIKVPEFPPSILTFISFFSILISYLYSSPKFFKNSFMNFSRLFLVSSKSSSVKIFSSF